MGILKNCACGYRSQAPASCAAKLNPPDWPILGLATIRTAKPIRPAQPEKISSTGFLCREHCFEFHLVPWIFLYHCEILHLVAGCVKQIPIYKEFALSVGRSRGGRPLPALGFASGDDPQTSGGVGTKKPMFKIHTRHGENPKRRAATPLHVSPHRTCKSSGPLQSSWFHRFRA